MNETRASIRRFISDTFFVDGFADDDSFLKTGILDSTGMLELIGFLEDTWAIKLDDGELIPENLDSVNRAAAFVQKKLGKV